MSARQTQWFYRLLFCVSLLTTTLVCLVILRPVPVLKGRVTAREDKALLNDTWTPPAEWDPVNPIYNDFHRYLEELKPVRTLIDAQ